MLENTSMATELDSGVTAPMSIVACETEEFKSKLEDGLDHFICRDGQVFAGTHLIVDFWNAKNLDDTALMEQAFREAVTAAKATLLHIHMHHFLPSGGVSGVAVLAESHISVHTWPEKNFAAFDVFMCGDSEPEKAIEVLKKYFQPGKVDFGEHRRGVIAKLVDNS